MVAMMAAAITLKTQGHQQAGGYRGEQHEANAAGKELRQFAAKNESRE
jgi:hypothetical protein